MRFSFAKNHYQVTAAVNAIIVLSALFVYDWIPLVDLVGQFLIDPDAPVKSNLIYLLGGDYMARAPLAASLLKDGFAPMILIAREPGKLTDTTIALLAAEGVPRTQITAFQVGRGVTSTADEAHALRLYVSIRALYWPARAALLHLAR